MAWEEFSHSLDPNHDLTITQKSRANATNLMPKCLRFQTHDAIRRPRTWPPTETASPVADDFNEMTFWAFAPSAGHWLVRPSAA